ncbi:hypothetical protein B0J13DRAFT_324056 [Dactylonectria estremocensis]|uniref:Uncharacterized protein n=1 Tax=Dactylonectria estremocensis TaxID=1079267 RepID=A0A9P9J7W4_9HYPO|nr:hypothetical protein B0J13DRAFT_324056 [Dactylonectria estremocensis]
MWKRHMESGLGMSLSTRPPYRPLTRVDWGILDPLSTCGKPFSVQQATWNPIPRSRCPLVECPKTDANPPATHITAGRRATREEKPERGQDGFGRERNKIHPGPFACRCDRAPMQPERSGRSKYSLRASLLQQTCIVAYVRRRMARHPAFPLLFAQSSGFSCAAIQSRLLYSLLGYRAFFPGPPSSQRVCEARGSPWLNG